MDSRIFPFNASDFVDEFLNQQAQSQFISNSLLLHTVVSGDVECHSSDGILCSKVGKANQLLFY